MSQATRAEFIFDDGSAARGDAATPGAAETLRASARELAKTLAWMPSARSSKVFANRCRTLAEGLRRALRLARDGSMRATGLRLYRESAALLESCFSDVYDALYRLRRLPHVRTPDGAILPRVLAIAEECLKTAHYRCDESVFALYVEGFQEAADLNLTELWTLIAALKLVLLERLVEYSREPQLSTDGQKDVAVCLESLRKINQTSWRQVIEPLILFDRYLQQDPVGAYGSMEPVSRELYRSEVANIAEHSEMSEEEVARAALELAQNARRSPHRDQRVSSRLSHIGYYLVAEGVHALRLKAGFRPPASQWLRSFAKAHPDELYFPLIALLTAVIAASVISLSEFDYWSFGTYVFMLLVLMVPCSEAAIQIVNYVALSLLTPQPLPKLDFSDGIPESCATLVTVPTLLLNEDQVRKVVDDLEVRFLGNHDRNLHFALLTDLPDSPTPPIDDAALAILCADLIEGLSEKYAGNGAGSFFLLHRERRYNPRERAWMGWERKRGKLLELNRFLCGDKDGYRITAGDLSVLSSIRYVIALDADTLLPRDTARRMIGALAHPLNQAIVDPVRNVVVHGYGILQPRVGVSIRSAARSRLAKIWSGQTGLDIYTRAVSDVYQDLYGEGTFVGKGIYEVAVLHRILDGRFPSNLLLSHDLIEGAYARSGLASDIEIIEGYPTLYSAYNRRKHRWLRGDWQVAEWLFPTVPGPHGTKVANPISLVSKWKILDNLRRSLVEPATFLLFVLGWLILPGSAGYWTLATICILLLPSFVRVLLRLARIAAHRKPSLMSTLPDSLFADSLSVFLSLIFLAHQMLLSIDAMVRALVRRMVTGQRLLEWVTSAQDEDDPHRRTALDRYLDWTPVLAIGLGVLVWWERGRELLAALPILALWASSKALSVWLNRSPHSRYEKSKGERALLRQIALRTWRFFADFSHSNNNWLIPDNVREDQLVADQRLSPTNLGFLLNSRQVACRLGYLTLPEFVVVTQRTLATVAVLRRHRGHFFNWYDGVTLDVLRPLNVSSVDSGNLIASLWTLEQGTLEQLRRPLVDPCLAEGLADHLSELVRAGVLHRKVLRRLIQNSSVDWLVAVDNLSLALQSDKSGNSNQTPEAHWHANQLQVRIESIQSLLQSYAPWLLREYRPVLRTLPELGFGPWTDVKLEQVPKFIDALQSELASAFLAAGSDSFPGAPTALRQQFSEQLLTARDNVVELIGNLRTIAAEAGALAAETDFTALLNHQRKLLAVELDTETQRLSSACYDQLASESRIATFAAIAKNDIPQESWFAPGRFHKVRNGHIILLSWAGTMFEYLMPCLWMNTFPDTLLERAALEAVRAQRAYADRRGVPWGISESASSQRFDDGSYKYFAFGLPELALRESNLAALVISPYSTLLAQHVNAKAALQNLRRMKRSGWMGAYGMYEAADFNNHGRRQRPELVRMWMAHHQGMALLAIANSLCDGVVRSWFHANPYVQSAELLLQERPVARVNLRPARPRVAA